MAYEYYEKEINPRTGQPYYANNAQEVINCLLSMNLYKENEGGILGDDGRVDRVYYFMDLAESQIDGQLEQYYFIPLKECNQVYGKQIKKEYPQYLRNVAVRLAAALMGQSQFQQNDPNKSEIARQLFLQVNEDIHKLALFVVRLPGQRLKSAISKTMPPTMQPGRDPEKPVNI